MSKGRTWHNLSGLLACMLIVLVGIRINAMQAEWAVCLGPIVCPAFFWAIFFIVRLLTDNGDFMRDHDQIPGALDMAESNEVKPASMINGWVCVYCGTMHGIAQFECENCGAGRMR